MISTLSSDNEADELGYKYDEDWFYTDDMVMD